MARLVMREGPEPGRAYLLEGGETTIGRAPGNDIVVRSDSVSRRHARLIAGARGYLLEDLGSKNGTRLDGRPVDGPVGAGDGQVMAFGDVVFEFQSDDPTVTLPAGYEGQAVRVTGRAISLDRGRALVEVRGEPRELPPKEYAALVVLFDRAGQVVSKEELAMQVWPEYDGDVSDYNIHQVVSRLRRAIEVDPSRPRLLVTRPGFGYRLDIDEG